MNTGSVGRHTDGDWRAGFAALAAGEGVPEVASVRVKYDLGMGMAAIHRSDLPDDFAEYLGAGVVPKATGSTAGAG